MKNIMRYFSVYRVTKIILLILIVPVVFLSVVSSLVMFNSKGNGGIPALFGNHAITLENSNFATQDTDAFNEGEVVLFKSLAQTDYKISDIIAYYAAEAEGPETPVDGPYWNESESLSRTFSAPAVVSADSNNATEIKVAKITNIGKVTDINTSAEYVVFAVKDSNSAVSDVGNYVMAHDVIGVATNSPDIFSSYLMLAASDQGFIFFVVIPCAVLLIVAIIAAFTGATYFKHQRGATKQKIIEEEVAREKGGAPATTKSAYLGGLKKPVPKAPAGRPAAPKAPAGRPAAPKAPVGRPAAPKAPAGRPAAPKAPVGRPAAPKTAAAPTAVRKPGRPAAPKAVTPPAAARKPGRPAAPKVPPKK